ncbi:hypothetical protein Y1Q_0007505 [Alligator mississippiensis]|uniref:Uncharacterized protein n=1 Tax=Alligator mississippiensis TaxID=8496 RepID=A0A151M4X7_ALLMI|nr:hypothetical protein Y1Q_0007505 [Alligator mississippiensis]
MLCLTLPLSSFQGIQAGSHWIQIKSHKSGDRGIKRTEGGSGMLLLTPVDFGSGPSTICVYSLTKVGQPGVHKSLRRIKKRKKRHFLAREPSFLMDDSKPYDLYSAP